jgi:hypothetical protein
MEYIAVSLWMDWVDRMMNMIYGGERAWVRA